MSSYGLKSLLLQVAQNENNEYWYVPLSKALSGLSAEMGAWKPGGSVNTIWQTLNHMNYYNQKILNKLTGNKEAKDGLTNIETFGSPGDPSDETAFAATCQKAENLYSLIRKELENMEKKGLSPEGMGTVDQTFLTEELPQWVQHDAYHIGQIVLIRKLRGDWKNNQ
ncbi:DinB family protein [Paenibacillus shunpengii]|uniref:DinB family protein n=1 Tax=Paenibacillus shunpengii TaxID=2054424 RepID=A0ABW5SN81_9BACL